MRVYIYTTPGEPGAEKVEFRIHIRIGEHAYRLIVALIFDESMYNIVQLRGIDSISELGDGKFGRDKGNFLYIYTLYMMREQERETRQKVTQAEEFTDTAEQVYYTLGRSREFADQIKVFALDRRRFFFR